MTVEFLLPEGVDIVVAEPLRFKQKLHIGRDAYKFLRAKDAAGIAVKTAGAAGLGGAVASSSVVASTFFAPTGVLAWLGLATAATPIGWIVAASVVAGGVALGATHLLDTDEVFVAEIPHFINTPLDVLATSLMNLIGRLAVRVALADGDFAASEREAIVAHFTLDWGYDSDYVERSLDLFIKHDGELSLEAIAANLNQFQQANPDCNHLRMNQELVKFVREIVEADGIVRPEEREALARISIEFGEHRTLVVRGREIAAAVGEHGVQISTYTASTAGEMLSALTTRLRSRSAQSK